MPKTLCPNGHALSVPAELVGRKAKCPKCQASFVISAGDAPEPRLKDDDADDTEALDDLPQTKPGKQKSKPAQPEPAADRSVGQWLALVGGGLTLFVIGGLLVFFLKPGAPAANSVETPKPTPATAPSVTSAPVAALADGPSIPKSTASPGSTLVVASKQQTAEAEVRRSLDEMIATLEAGDLNAYYTNYAPVEALRSVRGRGLNFANGGGQFNSLAVALKKFQGGDVAFEANKLVAHVTPRPVGSEKSENPEKTDSAVAIADPKDDKIELTGFGADLGQVLASAIAALEKGELETFVNRVFPSGELGRLKTHDGTARLFSLAKARPEMVQQMITDLKACQAATPQLDSEKTLATFVIVGTAGPPAKSWDGRPLTSPEPLPRTVKFQKVAGSWRFFDNSTRLRREIVRLSALSPPDLTYSQPAATARRRSDRTMLVLEKIGSAWRLLGLPPQ